MSGELLSENLPASPLIPEPPSSILDGIRVRLELQHQQPAAGSGLSSDPLCFRCSKSESSAAIRREECGKNTGTGTKTETKTETKTKTGRKINVCAAGSKGEHERPLHPAGLPELRLGLHQRLRSEVINEGSRKGHAKGRAPAALLPPVSAFFHLCFVVHVKGADDPS